MDESLLHALKDPGCYPGAPGSVELIQTHISVVCVAGEYAFKLKKPVALPFVDYSTQEARQRFCQEEVRLNRRLCPDTYLGVASLVEVGERLRFVLPGKLPPAGARLIDHATCMQRLPHDRMLDLLLESGDVTVADMLRLAGQVAEFHSRSAHASADSGHGSPDELEGLAEANFRETAQLRGRVFDPLLHDICATMAQGDFDRIVPTLRERKTEGRVVEGHGDLHARNVCLTDPPTVYDCIEFNEAFRWADTATENAFLLMDLRYRGHPELARAYLDAYVEHTGDRQQRELLGPLIRYRAMVRAKVDALASGEDEIPDEERARFATSARRHLNLVAASRLDEMPPSVVMSCGLPGAGKSYLLEQLARLTGWPVVRSDVVRKEMLGVAPTHRLPTSNYTPEMNTAVYDEMMRRADDALRRGSVLIDAGFRRPAQRQRVRDLAASRQVRSLLVWIQTSEEEVRRRLSMRVRVGEDPSDADMAVREALRSHLLPPDLARERPLLRVDGDLPVDALMAQVLAKLLTG